MQFKLNDLLSVRKIENEIFVLNRKTSKLHTFNDSGAILWEALGTSSNSEDLVRVMCDKYEVDHFSAEKDVAVFLDELCQINLIEPL